MGERTLELHWSTLEASSIITEHFIEVKLYLLNLFTNALVFGAVDTFKTPLQYDISDISIASKAIGVRYLTHLCTNASGTG